MRPTTILLALALALSATAAAPGALALGPSSCTATSPQASCVFSCRPGDDVHVQATRVGFGSVRGFATCSDASATCLEIDYDAQCHGVSVNPSTAWSDGACWTDTTDATLSCWTSALPN